MLYGRIIALILFELGFGLKFNLVGSISVSELVLMLYVPLFVLPKVRWREAASLRHVTVAYAALITTQIVSEFIVANSLSSSLKGLAVTVVSYLHFMFLVFFLSRQKSLILVLLLAQAARMMLFSTADEDQTVEDIMAGKSAAYLKFYGAPLIITIFLAFSMLSKHKYLPLLLSATGALLIVLGARSSGGMALLAGMTAYFLEHRSVAYNKKALIASVASLCAIIYGLYVYYVSQVLSGSITSGNNQQLLLCNNPYNPLELLLVGRSEAWVGWQAFMDEFWFGHGAWAYDSTGRYQRMMLEMHDELQTMSRSQMSLHYLIPSHSVLIGSGMTNGVFAFLSMGYIAFFFLWKGFACFIKCANKYRLVLIFETFEMFTMVLFSPQSHFRLTMPVAFAIIFVLAMTAESKRREAAKATEQTKPTEGDGERVWHTKQKHKTLPTQWT